jgi:hypothetical protein
LSKITSNFDREVFNEIKKNFNLLMPKLLREEILSLVANGKSPVASGRWDRPYSESYIKQINSGYYKRFAKRTSPINLELSGQMMSALVVEEKQNKIVCTFNDEIRNDEDLTNADLADIHNRRGAGKAKAIRRLLPTNEGEEFSRPIQMLFDDILRKVVRDAIR